MGAIIGVCEVRACSRWVGTCARGSWIITYTSGKLERCSSLGTSSARGRLKCARDVVALCTASRR